MLLFLSFCRFCLVFVLFCFHASLCSFVDVPLHLFPVQQTMYRIGNHIYDWVLVGMVEARSVNVKNTTATKGRVQTCFLNSV